MDYEKVLLDLIKPIVDDKETVSVKQMESLNDNEILLYVYANNDDVARLIKLVFYCIYFTFIGLYIFHD